MAWVTPLTPLVQLARGVSVGELGVVHVWCAAYVLVLAVVFYLLAARFMRQRLTR
ncbi:MAG: hypothetical protein U5O39_06875 [Gammaproteobacteria bacterium]|nr:hypothetical protein [Gammaproteobacteria bacterium]